MQFDKTEIARGETVNARAYGQDIVLYISRDNAVYKCLVRDYATSPKHSEPILIAYCDEASGLSGGGRVERRGENISIKT